MTLKLPNVVKQALLYGASIALMKGVSLLMLPFIAHHLPAEAYGRLEVVTSLAVIGSVVMGMGLDAAMFRFAGTTANPIERRRLAAEFFGLALLIGGTAGVCGWLIADTLALTVPGQLTRYEIRLVLLTLSLEGAIAIPLGWMRMCDKAVPFFYATTGRAILQALLVLALLSKGRGVEGVLEAGVIAAVLQAFIIGILHIRNTGFGFSRKTAYRSIIYSLPIVASGLVAFAWNGLDRIILADFASLIDVAQFGVAAKFSLAVVLLMQPFNMWWLPRRFEVLKQHGTQKVAYIISIGIVITLIISVLIGLATPLLVTLLLPPSYAMAGSYAVGIVMIMALREMAELVNLGCFAGNTTKAQFVINFTAATVSIIGMLMLIPEYAVWGVIFALLIAQSIRLLLFFSVSQHFVHIPYPLRSLFIFGTLSIACLTLGSQAESTALQLLITLAAVGCLLFIALILRLIRLPERLLTR